MGGVLCQTEDGSERPVAIISRKLTQGEQRMTPTEIILSCATYAMRKLRRYTEHSPGVRIVTPIEGVERLVRDGEVHARIKAYAIDLSMYRVTWATGRSVWSLQEDLLG